MRKVEREKPHEVKTSGGYITSLLYLCRDKGPRVVIKEEEEEGEGSKFMEL